MAMLGITPEIQRELKDNYGLEDKKALMVGSLVGAVFATVITHPMDTVKTCMQGDVERKKYSTMMSTGRTLCDEYGVRAGLFKALSWRTAQIFTTFALVNGFKQALAPVCFPQLFE
jgi:solute carrier family 25 carnitine/acylcarnitine transporter 20/29